LVIAVNEYSCSPASTQDFKFGWYRQYSEKERAFKIPGTDGRLAHYAPSVDDLGAVICLKCSDVFGLNMSKLFTAKIETVDPALIDIVEEAIEEERYFVKKTVVAVNAMVRSSDSARVDGKSVVAGGDEFDCIAELAGSVEVTPSGLLISERGCRNDSGILISPSSRLRVRCVYPTSFQIRVPLTVIEKKEEGSPVPESFDECDVNFFAAKQPSLRWLGDCSGELFEVLDPIVQEHQARYEAAQKRRRQIDERRARTSKLGGLMHQADKAVAAAAVAINNDEILDAGPSSEPFEMLIDSDESADIAGPAADTDSSNATTSESTPGTVGVASSDTPAELQSDDESAIMMGHQEAAVLDGGIIRGTESPELECVERATPSPAPLASMSPSFGKTDIERQLYEEVSLSLSHDSEPGGDLFAKFEDGLPDELMIQVFCRDRQTRDAMVLCIRSIVIGSSMLPNALMAPDVFLVSPSALKTAEQRKSLLPWHQLPLLHGLTRSHEPTAPHVVLKDFPSLRSSSDEQKAPKPPGIVYSEVESPQPTPELKQIISDLEYNIAVKTKLSDQQNINICNLENQLAALQSDLGSKDAEIGRLRVRLDQQQVESRLAASRLSETIDLLRFHLEEEREVVAERDKEIGSLRAAATDQSLVVASLEADVARLQLELSEMKKAMADSSATHSADMQNVETELQSLMSKTQEETKAMSDELESTKESLCEYMNKFERALKESEQLQFQLSAQLQQSAEARTASQMLRECVEQVEAEGVIVTGIEIDILRIFSKRWSRVMSSSHDDQVVLPADDAESFVASEEYLLRRQLAEYLSSHHEEEGKGDEEGDGDDDDDDDVAVENGVDATIEGMSHVRAMLAERDEQIARLSNELVRLSQEATQSDSLQQPAPESTVSQSVADSEEVSGLRQELVGALELIASLQKELSLRQGSEKEDEKEEIRRLASEQRLMGELEALRAELEVSKEGLRDAERAASEATERAAASFAEASAYRESMAASATECESLRAELAASQISLQAASAERSRLEAELEAAESDREIAAKDRAMLKELESKLSGATETVAQLRNEIIAKDRQITDSQRCASELKIRFESERCELQSQLAAQTDRSDELESRVVCLEQQVLVASDSKQVMLQQTQVNEDLKRQIKNLRQQLLEADQEAQSMRAILSEKHDIGDSLIGENVKLKAEVETLRNTLEKRKQRIEKLKQATEELEATTAQNKALGEENARLLKVIDALEFDRKELTQLRPQVAKLEASNADIKYQKDLLTNQTKRQAEELSSNAILIRDLESHVQTYEREVAEQEERCEGLGMLAEELRSCIVRQCSAVQVLEAQAASLREEVLEASTADPQEVQGLQLSLTRVQGERNYWENKVS
jgi:hypothetical protein